MDNTDLVTYINVTGLMFSETIWNSGSNKALVNGDLHYTHAGFINCITDGHNSVQLPSMRQNL